MLNIRIGARALTRAPLTVLLTIAAHNVVEQSLDGATIVLDEKLLFTTDAGTQVITRGNPVKVSLMLRRPATQTSPTDRANKPFEGTYWKAIELAGKAAPKQDAKNEAHLQFQTGGRLSGSDGCNRLAGSYQRNGDRITFGQIAGTQMACLNPSGTEGPFRDALKNASRMTVAADRLDCLMRRGRDWPSSAPAVKRQQHCHHPASRARHGNSSNSKAVMIRP